jgi:hypothetical protein
MKLIIAFSLALGLPVAAQELVYATAMPRATLSELAAIPMREPEPRVYEHRALPPLQFRLEGGGGASTIAAPATAITAPPVTTLFDADASRALVPADSAGAVGPAHILTTNNARVIVHDRTGKVLKSVSQDQFWSNGLPAGEYYDPRAEYDPLSDRFAMMAIYDELGLAFAVTETGDPAGAWRRYRIEEPGADFSMMAVTRDTFVFGTNGYDYDSTLLFSVRKQDLFSGAASIPMKQHTFGSAFVYPVSSAGARQFIVESDSAGLWIEDLDDRTWQINASAPQAWFTAPFRMLPQLGGSELDGGFGYLEDVQERSGWIYATMIRHAGDRPTVTWCRVNVTTREAEWGAVVDPQQQTVFAYPSLAVNRYGSMLIGFGMFSEGRYVSSGYVYRDFMGRVSGVTQIRAGTAPVTVHERWGDYTTTVVDPADDASFWTAQIHATNGSWGTTWAKVEVGTPKRRAARH